MITTIPSNINLIKTSNNALWNIFHKTLSLSVLIHVNNFILSQLRQPPTTLLLQSSFSLDYHKQHSSQNRQTLSTLFLSLSALPQMFAFLPIKYQNFISTYNPTHHIPALTTYHLLVLHFTILPMSPYRKSHIYISNHLTHIVALTLFRFLEKIAKEIASQSPPP